MIDVEMLKKYKELLDNNIITQEEYEKKKEELLADDTVTVQEEIITEKSEGTKVPKKQINKKFVKMLIIIAVIIGILFGGVSGMKTIIKNNQQSQRAAALEEEIRPIMNAYGLYTYEVRYVDYNYEVFAEGFESLTKGEGLAILKKLDGVSIDDPCGSDDEIDFGVMTSVHPGLDVEYSYWRVSSAIVRMNEMYGGNYKTPGIYCNQYGTKCIFEYDN